MNYLFKTITLLLMGSVLYSQGVDKDAVRITTDRKPSIELKDKSMQTILEESFETALFETINATEGKGWTQKFILVDNDIIEKYYTDEDTKLFGDRN